MYHLQAIINLLRNVYMRGINDTTTDLYSVVARPVVAPSLPRHLQIEIITRCNLICVMCPRTVALERSNSPEQKLVWHREMPFDKYLHIINQFPNVQTLSLHGIGEPLMHSHLFEMIEAAASRNIQVRFTTNATLLNRANCERLVESGLHRIIISLDGANAATYEAIRVGACFDRVIENVHTLVATRRDSKRVNPIIDINMVVSQENYSETVQMVNLAKMVGADGLMLSPLQPPEPKLASLACDWETWNKTTQAAAERARGVRLNLYLRGGFRLSNTNNLNNKKKTYQCLHPWLSSVLMMDGEVMPCCNIHNPAFSLGNIFVDDFAEVWRGSKYRSFRCELRRKGHVPEPCRWCPDF